MLTPSDNVLRNQLMAAQTRATNVNAMAQVQAGVGRGSAALGNYLRQNTEGGKQMQQNALTQSNAQAQVANVQSAEAERALITRAIQGVKSAPPEQQAQLYSQIVRDVESQGVDIPDWAEDFSNFDVIDAVYAMPAEQLTDWQRKMSMLGDEEDMLSAARISLGLKPSADARMRGQVGDRPLTNAAKLREDLGAGRITQEDFDRETAPRAGLKVGKNGYLEVAAPLGRSAQNTEQKGLASEINLYSQLQKVGELAGLDENGRMKDPSMLTYKGQAEDFITRQAEKLGIEPSELQRQATFKRTQFITGVEQLFNAYRKEITGAAAAVQELDRLKKSFINMDMSPTQFEAAYAQYTEELQRSMRVRRKLLREGFDLRDEQGGDMMDRLFLSGGDDDPAARFSELAAEHGDEKAYDMMMQEGY